MFKKKYFLFMIAVMLIITTTMITACSRSLTEGIYLMDNAKEINLQDNKDNSEFDSIAEDLKDKRIIITNEAHGVSENELIMSKMSNYLMDNWGLRYIFIEGGYAHGKILNKYIESGDEELLNQYCNIAVYSKGNTSSYIDYLKMLYEKNKSLTEDKKIQIIGLDVVEDTVTIEYYIGLIEKEHVNLSEEQLEDLNEFKEKIHETRILDISGGGSAEENKLNVINIVNELEEKIENNRLEYEKNLGEDLYSIEFILNNIRNSQDFTGISSGIAYFDNEFYRIRDKHTYENFKELDKHFKLDKCYIHYGTLHAYQKEFNGTKFLAAYMEEDEELKGKLYSINTIYNEGTKYEYGTLSEGPIRSITPELKDTLENSKHSEKDLLINLNRKNSPFKEKMCPIVFGWMESDGFKEEFNNNVGVTTDYFQSIIVINRPTPLEWIPEKSIKESIKNGS